MAGSRGPGTVSGFADGSDRGSCYGVAGKGGVGASGAGPRFPAGNAGQVESDHE